MLAWMGVAFAQAIPEGDFESPGAYTGWTVVAGNASYVSEDTSVYGQGQVLLIERRNPNLVVCSTAFVVTRQEVSARMHKLNATDLTSWWLREPGINVRLVDTLVDPNLTSYSLHTLDVSGQCGMLVEVCVSPEPNDDIAYDDFLLGGAPCPDWDDNDSDGVCTIGRDLDQSGDCADAGEFDDPAFDCDDYDPAASSLGVEICDGGIDNDCDPSTDEDVVAGTLFYSDTDHDGYGDDDSTLTVCVQPPDTSVVGGDCDDTRADAYPGATEQCNDLDDDCDTVADNDIQVSTWWPDADGDSYGDEDAPGVEDCRAPDGTVDNADDCDDGDPDVNPGASDPTVDGVDDDCDGHDGPITTEGDADTDTDADSDADADADADSDADADTTGTDPAPPDGETPAVAIQEGCGCGGGPSPSGAAILALLPALLLTRRRALPRV